MTMKEIEMKSGITRANIRYYEAEGLLAPVRRENKYRDYSEEDLEVLKKIKLLRSLQFSLEEIKALQSGTQELGEVLDRQIIKLEHEKTQIEQSQDVCRVMRDDGVRWKTLNAQHYLGILEQGGIVVSEEDVPAEVRAPWRRYFARSMDLLFYSVLWDVFRALVLGTNICLYDGGAGIRNQIVALLLMLVAEPVLLVCFGTTPGKWLLGLRVTDNTGKRLTFGAARARTWEVFVHGMGFGLPVWNLFRMWKSYRACTEGEPHEWEYDSAITQKDTSSWRIAAYIGAMVLLGVVFVSAFRLSALPKNRGDITVAEFCENYNRLAKFYGYEPMYCLDSEGKWVQERNPEGVSVVMVGDGRKPDYLFSETDGTMTGMRFLVEMQGSDSWIPDCRTEMILSILAFVGAQEENNVFSREVDRAVKAVQEAPFESFELSAYGIRISCEVAHSGCVEVPGMGMMIKDGGWYSLAFSMVKK